MECPSVRDFAGDPEMCFSGKFDKVAVFAGELWQLVPGVLECPGVLFEEVVLHNLLGDPDGGSLSFDE